MPAPCSKRVPRCAPYSCCSSPCMELTAANCLHVLLSTFPDGSVTKLEVRTERRVLASDLMLVAGRCARGAKSCERVLKRGGQVACISVGLDAISAEMRYFAARAAEQHTRAYSSSCPANKRTKGASTLLSSGKGSRSRQPLAEHTALLQCEA